MRLLSLIFAFAFTLATQLHAGVLTLSTQASSAGYSLTTFASGFPSNFGLGPLGITFTDNSHVLVSDYVGDMRVFSNSDGQLAGSPTASYGGPLTSVGLATLDGHTYLADRARSRIIEVSSTGVLVKSIVTNIGAPTGLVANPLDHTLLFGDPFGGQGIFRVDPTLQTTQRVLTSNDHIDGLAFDAATDRLYVAAASAGGGGHVLGYDSSFNKVFDSGPINAADSSIDGLALGHGGLSGNIYVNTNDGQFIQVNLGTSVQTVIANGGSRGDFVAVAPDGTLLITQSDSILRLRAPTGSGFGDPATVPEPSNLLVFSALVLLGFVHLSCKSCRKDSKGYELVLHRR